MLLQPVSYGLRVRRNAVRQRGVMQINYKRIFLDRQNRINAFWKIFGLLVLIFFLAKALYSVSHKLNIPQNWQNSFAILGSIIFTIIIIKIVDTKSLKDYGFYLNKNVAFSLLLGLVLFPLSIYLTHEFIISPIYKVNVQILANGFFTSAILISLIQNILVAVNEELIFRAYIISNIRSKIIALIVSTSLFVISHVGVNISSYAYLTVFGVFSFFIYVRYGIYLAILIHLLNNWVENMFHYTPEKLFTHNIISSLLSTIGRITIFLLLFYLIKSAIVKIKSEKNKAFA